MNQTPRYQPIEPTPEESTAMERFLERASAIADRTAPEPSDAPDADQTGDPA